MIISIICGLTLVFLVVAIGPYRRDGEEITFFTIRNEIARLRRARISKKELRKENHLRNRWTLEKFIKKENDAMVYQSYVMETMQAADLVTDFLKENKTFH